MRLRKGTLHLGSKNSSITWKLTKSGQGMYFQSFDVPNVDFSKLVSAHINDWGSLQPCALNIYVATASKKIGVFTNVNISQPTTLDIDYWYYI